MTILIFLVVLVALILVHEFGHFVVAKLSGIRVDEFGIGFPPRAAVVAKVGETEYTLNWLPIGGFVKIYGEDAEADGARSFISKPRPVQALVLVAGIAMNLLFAFVLLSIALMVGMPRALTTADAPYARSADLAVAQVLPGSPAATAGLMEGDIIWKAQGTTNLWTTGPTQAFHPETFTSFVSINHGTPIVLTLTRNGKEITATTTPAQGIVSADPSRYALGIQVATLGIAPLPPLAAILQGAELTYGATIITAEGLLHFFYGIFTLSADLSQVAGPIGIEGAVGSSASAGLGSLLSLVALISINLALINLIPIPALDGGRLLFVLIESIIRRPIKKVIAQRVNAIGYAFLVLLIVVVSLHDVYKIVG